MVYLPQCKIIIKSIIIIKQPVWSSHARVGSGTEVGVFLRLTPAPRLWGSVQAMCLLRAVWKWYVLDMYIGKRSKKKHLLFFFLFCKIFLPFFWIGDLLWIVHVWIMLLDQVRLIKHIMLLLIQHCVRCFQSKELLLLNCSFSTNVWEKDNFH